MTQPCSQIRESFSAYVDGEVTKSERAIVESHLSACPACRDTLSETVRLVSKLGSLQRVEPGPGYLAALRQRMSVEESFADRVMALLSSQTAVYRFSFAAACVVCVVITADVALRPGAGTARGKLGEPAVFAAGTPAPLVIAEAGVPRGLAPSLRAGRDDAPKAARTPAVRPVGPAPIVLAKAPRPGAGEARQRMRSVKILGPKLETLTRASAADRHPGDTEAGESARPVNESRMAPGQVLAQPPPIDLAAGGNIPGRVPKLEPEPVVEAVQVPAIGRRKLTAVLPAGLEVIEGTPAETAASTATPAATIQIEVSDVADCIKDLVRLVDQIDGLSMRQVLVLSAPAIDLHLGYSGSQQGFVAAVEHLKAGVNGLPGGRTVAVDADGVATATSRLVRIRLPLAGLRSRSGARLGPGEAPGLERRRVMAPDGLVSASKRWYNPSS
ncbi:MAG: zf-HC2 domain-containing protein [Candidatus Riflebacteria bacterium]|nr:zf-HC2 domain-containing protein [Candidatus Riflebacteria bacterium]